jgi:hypothetical protein
MCTSSHAHSNRCAATRPDGHPDRHAQRRFQTPSSSWSPGSEKPVPVMSDQLLIDWLRTAAPNCRWTASVCTGAGLYAAEGLPQGTTTTTRWGFRHNLRALGIEVVADRVVWQGNHISGAASRQESTRHRRSPPRPRPQARGVAAAGYRIRPSATIQLRLADQSRRQHTAACVTDPPRRAARPSSHPSQRTGNRRTTPPSAPRTIRTTSGQACPATSHPLTLRLDPCCRRRPSSNARR